MKEVGQTVFKKKKYSRKKKKARSGVEGGDSSAPKGNVGEKRGKEIPKPRQCLRPTEKREPLKQGIEEETRSPGGVKIDSTIRKRGRVGPSQLPGEHRCPASPREAWGI